MQTCLCGCMMVKTGTGWIAICSLILGILELINSVAALCGTPTLATLRDESSTEYSKWILVGCVVESGVVIILSVILLIAVNKNNARWILPWLFWNYFVMAIFIVAGAVLWMLFILSRGLSITTIVWTLLCFVGFGIYFYLIGVVQKFKMELEKTQNSAVNFVNCSEGGEV